MAQVVVMPKMGQTMEEGNIVDWMKKEGDTVEKGEILLTIESDKATLEVEADFPGILVKVLATAADGAMPCFTPIAIMGDPGETVDVEKVLADFNAQK